MNGKLGNGITLLALPQWVLKRKSGEHWLWLVAMVVLQVALCHHPVNAHHRLPHSDTLTHLRLNEKPITVTRFKMESRRKSISQRAKPRLKSIRLTGTNALPLESVLNEVLTQSNTTYFGFLKLWRDLNNAVAIMFPDSTRAQDWARETFGELQKEFDPEILEMDILRIRDLYVNLGYPFIQITPKITYDSDSSQVSVRIEINEGTPLIMTKVIYFGLDSLSQNERADLNKGRILKEGAVYSSRDIVAERNRIVTFLQKIGYIFFSPDSIKVTNYFSRVRSQSELHISVNLGQRLKAGYTSVTINNPDESVQDAPTVLRDSALGIPFTYIGDKVVSPLLVARNITYKPDDLASVQERNETIRLIGGTSIFENINFRTDSVSEGVLYSTIELYLSPRHQFSIKPQMDSRNEVPNLSLSSSYINRNLFEGAESFRGEVTGGIQLVYPQQTAGQNVFGNLIYNIDTRIEFGVPYFYNARNRLFGSLQYSILQQQRLKFEFGRFRVRGNIFPNRFQQFTLDLLDLEYVQRSTAVRREEGEEGDDIQINNGLTLSNRLDFIFSNQNELDRILDVKLFSSVELAGLIPYLFDLYVERNENDRAARPEARLFGTLYNQFLRLNGQISFSKVLFGESVTAFKLAGGYMIPFLRSVNNTPQTPLERQFIGGGPNSLRGWPFAGIGPGATSDFSNPIISGRADIRFESSLEQRLNFFSLFGFPAGLVFFGDVGNVWDREGENALSWSNFITQIGWDVGLGLRIYTPIGPIRFDFAYRVYDPTQPIGSRWQIDRWQLGFTGSNGVSFNFGIGEVF